MTVNGLLEFERTIYWNAERGSSAPLDAMLGILQDRYSAGVREMCCRLSLDSSFIPASENLQRTAQLSLSSTTIREIVETQGRTACTQLQRGEAGPNWSAEDCSESTLITGADGVMVPLVTEAQKAKCRQTQARKRKARGKKSTRRAGRPRKGSDGPYKEFKILAFYDTDKSHQYVTATSGNHQVLGRIMRREAAKVKLDKAEVKYSVTDGADWIRKQYNQQLPMLDENILDYYHLREHVITASYRVFGEGTAEALAWREEMMGLIWNDGPIRLLENLGQLRRSLRARSKIEALASLQNYVGKRMDMLDYPAFRAAGYDLGSGVTEAFCGTLTDRLKGPGMRWDKDNAEAMMALTSIYQSQLWEDYWSKQRQAA